MTEKTIYERAIERFGKKNQVKKCAEECLELALALIHYEAGKIPFEGLASEIADVSIMSRQVKSMFGNKGLFCIEHVVSELAGIGAKLSRPGILTSTHTYYRATLYSRIEELLIEIQKPLDHREHLTVTDKLDEKLQRLEKLIAE